MNKYFLTDVQRQFHEMVRRFADERIVPLAADIDERDEFPTGLFREMAGLGLLGATLDIEAVVADVAGDVGTGGVRVTLSDELTKENE